MNLKHSSREESYNEIRLRTAWDSRGMVFWEIGCQIVCCEQTLFIFVWNGKQRKMTEHLTQTRLSEWSLSVFNWKGWQRLQYNDQLIFIFWNFVSNLGATLLTTLVDKISENSKKTLCKNHDYFRFKEKKNREDPKMLFCTFINFPLGKTISIEIFQMNDPQLN